MWNRGEKHSFEESGHISPSEVEAILQRLASVSVPFESSVSQLDSEPVSQRKRTTTAAATLPDLEAKYRTLVDQIPAVVFMAFLDRGISEAYISPQIESILGFSQEEWLNDPVRWYSQIHPDDKARWSAEAASLFFSGEPVQSTYRVMARDGHVIWFHCEAKMVRDDDGRPWFIHGVAFDITDFKRSEEALKKAHDELEARVRQRTAELERTNADLQEEREIVETVS